MVEIIHSLIKQMSDNGCIVRPNKNNTIVFGDELHRYMITIDGSSLMFHGEFNNKSTFDLANPNIDPLEICLNAYDSVIADRDKNTTIVLGLIILIINILLVLFVFKMDTINPFSLVSLFYVLLFFRSTYWYVWMRIKRKAAKW